MGVCLSLWNFDRMPYLSGILLAYIMYVNTESGCSNSFRRHKFIGCIETATNGRATCQRLSKYAFEEIKVNAGKGLMLLFRRYM